MDTKDYLKNGKHGGYRIVAVSQGGGRVEFPGMRTLHAACTVLQYCTGKGFPVSYRQRFSRIVQAKGFPYRTGKGFPVSYRQRFYRIVQAKVLPYRTGKGFTVSYRQRFLPYSLGLYRLFNFIFSAACYSYPRKATFQD